MRLLSVLLAVALATTASVSDAAAPAVTPAQREHAKEAFRRGAALFKLGELERALAAFKAAYQAFDDPQILFQHRAVRAELGHKREALRTYRVFLHDLPTTPNRAEVERHIAALEAALRAEQREAEAAAARAKLAPVAAQPAVGAAPAPAPAPRRSSRWWIGLLVGGVAAAGLAVGLGVGLSQPPGAPSATTTDGTLRPFEGR